MWMFDQPRRASMIAVARPVGPAPMMIVLGGALTGVGGELKVEAAAVVAALAVAGAVADATASGARRRGEVEAAVDLEAETASGRRPVGVTAKPEVLVGPVASHATAVAASVETLILVVQHLTLLSTDDHV